MSAPSSTYRVQLRPGFGFAEATEVAVYLDRLGIGALYTSPVLAAAPGSTHGYDVVDPTRANPELGGEQGRQVLAARLRSLGLGWVLDIVPNHMSVAVPVANPWWWDVLTHGPDSRYAKYFDIASFPVLVPVLASDDDLPELRGDRLAYYDNVFPIAPGTEGGTAAEIHDRQHYRLVHWKRASAELNYRRFFDVTTLAAVRVEDEEVFTATHAEVLRWIEAGDVTGLRVDHPDGLTDPAGYFTRLHTKANVWLVVEKILEPDETLPESWPVDGTTGYDALRELGGVFIDPTAEPPLTTLADSLGVPTDFATVRDECRQLVATTSLAAEVTRIATIVKSLAHQPNPALAKPANLLPSSKPTADNAPAHPGGTALLQSTGLTRSGDTPMILPVDNSGTTVEPVDNSDTRVERAVAELLAAFPVYRSYLPDGVDHWTAAVSSARTAWPELADILDLIDDQVRRDPSGELAHRIQQTSGMVVAKGTEDTAFYRCTRFIALNEVGGAPERFGLSVPEFHTAMAARASTSMTALSTHDTKRSEDVRARLSVLAELPDEWAARVNGWSGFALSEPALNLLAWQTVVGAWPITADRLAAYLDKAAKEAKLRTNWVEHDDAFEAEVNGWPDRILGTPSLVAEIEAFVGKIRGPGWSTALGQKLVQLSGPGVPDVYQGSELWDLSLVDPDNRRPVDFDHRTELLTRLEAGWQPPVDDTGAAKLHLVRTALRLRRSNPELFTGYRPLQASGPSAEHVIAFARSESLVAVATRLPVRLAETGWRNTRLPLDGRWTDLLTGRDTDGDLAAMLADYPVALLVRD